MSKGMIKVFLFYQRLARKEKLLLLLLAGRQALYEYYRRGAAGIARRAATLGLPAAQKRLSRNQHINILADREGAEPSSRRWPPPREGLTPLPPATLALRHPPPSAPLEVRRRGAGSQAGLLAA